MTCEECGIEFNAEPCTKHNDGRLKRFCEICWAEKRPAVARPGNELGLDGLLSMFSVQEELDAEGAESDPLLDYIGGQNDGSDAS